MAKEPKRQGNLADDSDFQAVSPPTDIVCKDCRFRNDGTIYSQPYTKGSCQKFPYPGIKPLGVMTRGEPCPEYKKED